MNAIITGSNRGIGLETLRLFAENGYNIWACARKESDEFTEVLNQIRQKNPSIWIEEVYFDLLDEESVKAGIKKILLEKKSIDVLVNMAGIAHYGLFQMASSSVMHEVMQVNYFSAMILCQNVLKAMSKNGGGCIINVASVAAMDSHQGDSIYGASKAALCQSSRVMAAENGKNGIRVNIIAPGPTDTDMIALHRDKIGDAIVQNCSMGRLGRKDEIAQVALFLASEKAGFINGQIIRVDGGSL